MNLTLELHNRPQAWAVIKSQLYPFLSRCLQADRKLMLTVKPRPRSLKQNRRYWGNGVLAQIAAQATVGGKLYSAESWHEVAKRKFIGVEELPDGSVVGMSSTKLTTAEFCEFSDQVEAWAATELGVVFVDLMPHEGWK